MAEKPCSRCKETLPAHTFNRDASRPDGLQSYCRACKSAYNREWWEHVPRWVVSNWQNRRNERRRLNAIEADNFKIQELEAQLQELGVKIVGSSGMSDTPECTHAMYVRDCRQQLDERYDPAKAWETASLEELRGRLGFAWKRRVDGKVGLEHDPAEAAKFRNSDWSTPQRKRHLSLASAKYAGQLDELAARAAPACSAA